MNDLCFGGALARFYHHSRNKDFETAPMYGNSVVLNFINTKNNHKKRDYLTSYDAFLYWCYEAKVIPANQYHELEFESYCNVLEASGKLQEVLQARTCLEDLFNAIQARQEIKPDALSRFQRLVATTYKHLNFDYVEGNLIPVFLNPHEELLTPLWHIVYVTIALLTTRRKELSLLKKCPGCGALYLDTGKSKTRNWCSPTACGKRLRNRRYYKSMVLSDNKELSK